jgi:hypothetical protein
MSDIEPVIGWPAHCDNIMKLLSQTELQLSNLNAEFDQMVMECFEVVSTTDVDQNGNNIERRVPKHHLLEADLTSLREENGRLRQALEKIASYDDVSGEYWHLKTGSFAHFDEPGSVEIARSALEFKP